MSRARTENMPVPYGVRSSSALKTHISLGLDYECHVKPPIIQRLHGTTATNTKHLICRVTGCKFMLVVVEPHPKKKKKTLRQADH